MSKFITESQEVYMLKMVNGGWQLISQDTNIDAIDVKNILSDTDKVVYLDSISSDVNPKDLKILKLIPKTKSLDLENIDYSDFSKIQDEVLKDSSKVIKNDKGDIVLKIMPLFGSDKIVINSIEYVSGTKTPLKLKKFSKNGKIHQMIEYQNGKEFKIWNYGEINTLIEKDLITNQKIKQIRYKNNVKEPISVDLYAPDDGRKVETFEYSDKNLLKRSIKWQYEYHDGVLCPNKSICTYYKEDGISIDHVELR